MSTRRDREEHLDRAFLALADPVRRSIVAQLSRGPASVGELAAPHPITPQAVSRHVRVLEAAGLVTRSRQAQRRPVHLDAAALEALTSWIDRYRLAAEARYRRLDAVVSEARADVQIDARIDVQTPPGTTDGAPTERNAP